MAATRDAQRCTREMRDPAWDVALAMSSVPKGSADEHVPGTSAIPEVGGGEVSIRYNPVNFKAKYVDEYTREPLPLHPVKAAIIKELEYVNSRVWEVAEAKGVMKDKDSKIIRTFWVIVNKGGVYSMICGHASLCAKAIHTRLRGTPPAGIKQAFPQRIGHRARRSPGYPLALSSVDVRKAYVNGVPLRRLHLFFPNELGLEKGAVAHLKRCVYGKRDAGMICEDCYAHVLINMGFRRGIASPCCVHHPERRLSLVFYGDDFTCLGTLEKLKWYEPETANAFEMKVRGRLGEPEECDKEIRVLNRIAKITADGISYEAGPRHAEMVIQAPDILKHSVTPGDKDPDIDTNAALDLDHSDETVGGDYKPVAVITTATSRIKFGRRTAPRPPNTHVTFGRTEYHDVAACSEIDGVHPKRIVATTRGWKFVPENCHPFNWKAYRRMADRFKNVYPDERLTNLDRERV